MPASLNTFSTLMRFYNAQIAFGLSQTWSSSLPAAVAGSGRDLVSDSRRLQEMRWRESHLNIDSNWPVNAHGTVSEFRRPAIHLLYYCEISYAYDEAVKDSMSARRSEDTQRLAL
ncbi:hypothetical protein PG990_011591 [Apiospora arundinis]